MEKFRQKQRAEERVQVRAGEVFSLPTNAVPRCAKYDEGIDSDSDYDESVELQLGNEYAKEAIQASLEELKLDIDGRELPIEKIYDNFEAASAFTPMIFNGRAHEIPCIALWDYWGGHTCLDMNVTAGSVVHVAAEEYQVREISANGFLRIPLNWSLVTMRSRNFVQPMGLVPSSWLVAKKFYDENQALFIDSWWCLGVCRVDVAINYLTEDVKAQQPGLFVIFSPNWLNLDPSDHRPFILLMQCERSKLMEDNYMKEGDGQTVTDCMPLFRRETDESRQPKTRGEIDKGMEPGPAANETDSPEARKVRTKNTNMYRKKATAINRARRTMSINTANQEGGKRVFTQSTDAWMTRRKASYVPKDMKVAAKEDTKEVNFDSVANYVNSGLVTRAFTITRSYMGDYELFGNRYTTLYDLVFHLANNRSELPHKLVYGMFTDAPGFPYMGVPPPRNQPMRDPAGITMMSEQWAARHYSQVTEPACLSTPYSFVTRTLLNPMKNLHATLARIAGLPVASEQEAHRAVAQFAPTKSADKKKGEGSKEDSKLLPDESALLSVNEKLMIKKEFLKYNSTASLGKGEFGTVCKGTVLLPDEMNNLAPVECAIKSQKLLRTEKNSKLAWLGEMETLSMTCHPNVIAFFGYRIEKEENNALLVFELASMGSLDGYCKNLNYELSDHEVVDFLTQISRGMGHLHTREPCIVHGDLAARNVLVHPHYFDNTKQVLKITDLGLSKTVRPETHTSYDDPNKIPFKWLPPEVLKGRELTWTSDVWSYGMVAHELYGIGEPYGMIGAEKVVHLIADGHRFDKQPKMPHFIYEIVLQCQRRVPYDRPSMREIELQLLEHVIEDDTEHRKKLFRRYLQDSNVKNAELDW